MKKILFLLVVMLVNTVSLFAEEKVVTITGKDSLWNSAQDTQIGTKDGVTIKVNYGTLSSSGEYRTYKNSKFTVSVAEGEITGIELTCTVSGTQQYGPGCFASPSTGKYTYSGTTGRWAGSAKEVTLTASSDQVRMTCIKVTYVAETRNLASLAISGTPAKTTYHVDENFSTDGLVATATFDDGSTGEVTSEAVWTCKPAKIATDTKTVTATATYMGLTASETYDVIVNATETEQSVSFVPADKTDFKVWTSGSGAPQTGTKGGVTVSCTSGYLEAEYRMYANSTLSVSVSNGMITEILFSKVTDSKGKNAPASIILAPNSAGGTLATVNTNNRKWTGEASVVEFACSAQARFSGVTVKYVPDNTVIPYEVKAEWGTIILPFEWTAPEGWTCYSCNEVDANGVLRLVGVDKVEKNVPYIINVGTEAIGKTHDFSGHAVEAAAENRLAGVLTGVLVKGGNVPAGSYILSKYEGKTGFFRVSEGADYPAAQYRCYVTLPKEDTARYGALSFDVDVETGIDDISCDRTMKHGSVIYNIMGQRMSRTRKGLNIVDGKVLLK